MMGTRGKGRVREDSARVFNPGTVHRGDAT
jgi:hypothetical protein